MKVADDHNFPPYCFLKDGKPTGFNVELIQAVAEVMGLKIECSLGPWAEVRKALESGKIDAISGMFFSPARSGKLHFTTPHSHVFYGVFVRKDSPFRSLDDIKGREILVQDGDIGHDFVIQEKLTEKIIPVNDVPEMLRRLSAGKHDAAILASIHGYYFAEKLGLTNLTSLDSHLFSRDYCIAVGFARENLRDQFDAGLNILKATGKYKIIYDRWFRLYEPDSRDFWRRYGKVVFVAAALLLIAFFWISLLRRTVQRRTAELEQANLELKGSEERFRLLAENTNDYLCELDDQGNYLYINPNYLQLGYSLEEIQQLGPRQLIHPDDRDGILGQVAKAFAERRNFTGHRYRAVKRTGETCWIETSGSVFQTSAGGWRLVAVSRDITERLRLEEQLLQSQKMEALGQLAGGISHDLNNILTCILGYGELLRMNAVPESREWKGSEVIISAAKRGAELLRQLLGFARRGKHLNTATNIHAVIGEVIALLKHSIDKRILLETAFNADISCSSGDPGQLLQMLLNLAVNAQDAMPEGGTLRFETAVEEITGEEACQNLGIKPGRFLLIKVSDTGKGIPAEIQGKVFEPFFTTKPPGKGTGMGLAMVYGIVRNHGGAIQLASNPGQGTTFSIHLPLSTDAPAVQPGGDASLAPKPGTGTILVVDDEPMVRETLATILATAHFTVLCAGDGSEGVQIFADRHQAIDLVVFDMVMPKMDGKAFFQELKKIDSDVKGLLLSGYDQNDRIQEVLDLGACAFLQKPFTYSHLLDRVTTLLASSGPDRTA